MSEALTKENLACPFCGCTVDPEGWLSQKPSGEYERGPECNMCGATASSLKRWNTRTGQPPKSAHEREPPHCQSCDCGEPAAAQAQAVECSCGNPRCGYDDHFAKQKHEGTPSVERRLALEAAREEGVGVSAIVSPQAQAPAELEPIYMSGPGSPIVGHRAVGTQENGVYLCSDCPPRDYARGKARCAECPRASATKGALLDE